MAAVVSFDHHEPFHELSFLSLLLLDVLRAVLGHSSAAVDDDENARIQYENLRELVTGGEHGVSCQSRPAGAVL